MKAAYLNALGDADQLIYGDLADPTPGPGDVLLRVRAAAVTRTDVNLRSGAKYFPFAAPHVLGQEAAGEIAALGAGVSGFRIGERVIAVTKTGAYAELALADASALVRAPDGLPLEDAAVFAATAPAAYRLVVRRAAVRPGEIVLVTAAAGGMGSMIVQIAKAAGALVIATAGSPRKLEAISAAGADVVIDHYHEELDERLLDITQGKGVDVAIDSLASSYLFPALVMGVRPGGRLVVYGDTGETELMFPVRAAVARGLSLIAGEGDARLVDAERAVDTSILMQLAAAGRVKALKDRVLPLAQAAEAHRAMDDFDVAGRIILTP